MNNSVQEETYNRVVHINASPGFLDKPDNVDLIKRMVEIADRITCNLTIIETHYGLN